MPDHPHTRAPQHALQSTAKETLMTNDNFNDAARIIDEHRVISTAFGSTREGRSGRWATCLCGHESASYYDEQTAPIDSENNPERDVQRKHAVHIADVLARAARRDEENR